jgi:hypothetical protein
MFRYLFQARYAGSRFMTGRRISNSAKRVMQPRFVAVTGGRGQGSEWLDGETL